MIHAVTVIPVVNSFTEVRSFRTYDLSPGSAAATDTNRRNRAPHPTLHGLLMMLFWLLWVGLVLGGLIASLWYQEGERGHGFRRPSRAAVRKPDARFEARQNRQPLPVWARGDLLPPPRVVTNPGPSPGRPAG